MIATDRVHQLRLAAERLAHASDEWLASDKFNSELVQLGPCMEREHALIEWRFLTRPGVVLGLLEVLEAAEGLNHAAAEVLSSAMAGPGPRSSVSTALLDKLEDAADAYHAATTAKEGTTT